MHKHSGAYYRMKRYLMSIGFFLFVPLALWFIITQPIAPLELGPAHTQVSAQALEQHVRMLSNTLPSRNDNPDTLALSADYIETVLRASGARVSLQRYKVSGIEYRNVIAQFGPDTQERIVIGAHYDSAEGFPGADDNASGVAGLLELARLFGAKAPRQQIELVAYTLEEPPYFRTQHMGSAVHAQQRQAQGASIRFMLALEMIGYYSEQQDSQTFPAPLLGLFYPSQGNFIALVGRLGDFALIRAAKRSMRQSSDLPVYSINAPAWIPGIDFSDHLNYWQYGIPAIMVTDTAFYRNYHYHSAQDTAEKLDYLRMAKVVTGVEAFIRDVTARE